MEQHDAEGGDHRADGEEVRHQADGGDEQEDQEEKLTEVGEKKIVMSTDGVSSTMADRLYEKVLNLKFKVVFYVPFADLSKVPGVKKSRLTAQQQPSVRLQCPRG